MADNLKRIRLLGSSFSLKVDEDPVYFDTIIAHLEKVISKIEGQMGVRDPLRTAIISCILLTDELFKERKNLKKGLSEKEADEVEKKTLEIIKLIDSTL